MGCYDNWNNFVLFVDDCDLYFYVSVILPCYIVSTFVWIWIIREIIEWPHTVCRSV